MNFLRGVSLRGAEGRFNIKSRFRWKFPGGLCFIKTLPRCFYATNYFYGVHYFLKFCGKCNGISLPPGSPTYFRLSAPHKFVFMALNINLIETLE